MRKFQRVAVVAAAIAGLSAFGAGVSFAHDHGHDDEGVTAVANSQSNAVAYDDDSRSGRHGSPDAAPAFTTGSDFSLGNVTPPASK